MRRYEPGTNIIGCVRRVNRHGLPEVDKYGTPVFHVPKPIYYQQHGGNQQREGRMIENPQVPVYRGISASLAGYMRGQARRAQRKQMAEEIKKEKLDGK